MGVAPGQLVGTSDLSWANAPQRRERARNIRRYRSSDGQTILGYSSMILGGLALGSVFLGYLQGSEVVPMFITSACGLAYTTLWCARDKQYQVAAVFGVVAAFNLSYSMLQLGVTNSWFGIPIQDLGNVVSVYSGIWIAIFTLLSFVAFQASPGAFAVFMASDVSLGLVIAANTTGSLTLLRWASVPMILILIISVMFLGDIARGWHRRNKAQAVRMADAATSERVQTAFEYPSSDRRELSDKAPRS